MRVLFVGDVTGPAAVEFVVDHIERLRRRTELDLVIVNADNTSVTGTVPMGGSGTTPDAVRRLHDGGVDIVTTGTHAFDGPPEALVQPRVLRPHNVGDHRPGCGVLSLDVHGETVSVITLTSSDLLADRKPLWPSWRSLAHVPGTRLVHFVGTTHDVRVFAHAVDGTVAAVLGTLSHEATSRHDILPGGTGFVPDVGMAGPRGGIGGFEPDHFIAHLTGGDATALPPYQLRDGEMIFDAVVLDVEHGACVALHRVDAPVLAASEHAA